MIAALLFCANLYAANPSPTPLPAASPPYRARTLDEESSDVDLTSPIKAWTVQGLYTGASYGPSYSQISQVVARADVLQIGRSLLRITLPRYAWVTTPSGTIHGLGDTFLIYLFSLPPAGNNRFGVGLNAVIPTANKSQLGIDSWAIGPSAAQVHFSRASQMATGFLFQSYFSFAGPVEERVQSALFFQPIAVKRLAKGWSVRSADATWAFDLHRGSSIVPISLGVGKLLPLGGDSINLVLTDSLTVIAANAPNAPKNTIKLVVRWMNAPAGF